jgi:GxxExxY protein
VDRCRPAAKDWNDPRNHTNKHEEEIQNRNPKEVLLMAKLVLKEEVYEIIGAAMDVYHQLGRGFLEPIYQEAFQIELRRRGLPFEPQVELTIEYKGQPLKKKYVADVVCFNQIIVELKALDRLTSLDEGQLLNT